MSTTTSREATSYEVGHLYDVDPATLQIGTNVRTDTRPDAKAFAASIKARGVLEVITAHPGEDGALVVQRGQRRTVVAAKVGTPTGTVPVRVVPAPEDADRIVDQLSENLHREGMHARETRDAVEQLALLGVSAAQITKRTALARTQVDQALAVVGNAATKERMDSTGMTLEIAAIFAEFEDDPDAVATLTQAWETSWRREQIPHIAQRLRDARAEDQALRVEVERLRAEGLPVLDPDTAPDRLHLVTLANLLDAEGNPVPEESWPSIEGAAVIVTIEWVEPDYDEDDEEADVPDATQAFVPVWVCTDPAAAGLHYRYGSTAPALPHEQESDQDAAERAASEEAEREKAREERRTVIANNKAWTAATTVRRDWLAGLLTRRTVPAGAEVLIARAVIGRVHSLSHTMTHGNEVLADLLGITDTTGPSYAAYGNTARRVIDKATTPKAATIRTLAVVLAAWEDRAGTHTWRNPGEWDCAVMTALIGWGYPASDVEQLLVPDAARITGTN